MTDTPSLEHTGPLWRWSAKNGVSWYFVTISGDAAETLMALSVMRRLEFGKKRGWGTIRISVTLGNSHWMTSVLPEKDSDNWLLPIKADIRKSEHIDEGDTVTVILEPV